MTQEIWKPIEAYPGYEISNHGRVRSLDRYVRCLGNSQRMIKGQLLRCFISRSTGYMQIALSGNRKSVHRLVAEAFCSGWFEGAVVNHKNGVRDDNRASNLEWVTISENLKHGFRVLGAKKPYEGKFSKDHSTSKAVVSTHLKTGEETFYWCALDAVRAGDFDSGGISRCCHGIWKFHKGHYWRFATDDECERMAKNVEVAA